jgi:hypothetical protein
VGINRPGERKLKKPPNHPQPAQQLYGCQQRRKRLTQRRNSTFPAFSAISC